MSNSNSRTAAIFAKAIADHLEVIRHVESQQPVLESIARAMSGALQSGNKILWCGNGGSAADSQHMAAELIGRFRRERRGLPSIALTTDTSILTAIGNDYGFETVFSRQVEALGCAGDVLLGMSTSGNSPNVVKALIAARARGMVTVVFTGAGGGKVGPFADYLFAVESRDTPRIQEAHTLASHMICDWIEQDCVEGEPAGAGV